MTREDSLAPEHVEPLLTGRFGRPYVYEASCESTQELLGADLPEGALAVCDEQTHGRGRLGRSWTAPPGTAILCSLLLRPPENRIVSELSLVAGTAVAEAIEEAVGLAVQVKWPNDVMLNRRKVAGILAEAADGRVVVGIGVNVNQERDDLPEDTNVPAASLYTSDGIKRERGTASRGDPRAARGATTTPGSSAASTASTTASARATSSAAGGSSSTARVESGSGSTGTVASSSTSAASSAPSSPARSRIER